MLLRKRVFELMTFVAKDLNSNRLCAAQRWLHVVGAVVPRRPAAGNPALHGRMRAGIGVGPEHGGYVLGAPGACKSGELSA